MNKIFRKTKHIILIILAIANLLSFSNSSYIYADIIRQKSDGRGREYMGVLGAFDGDKTMSKENYEVIEKSLESEKKESYTQKKENNKKTDMVKDDIQEKNKASLSEIKIDKENYRAEAEKRILPITKNKLNEEKYGEDTVYTLTRRTDYDTIIYYIHGGSYLYDLAINQMDFCDKLIDLVNAKIVIPLYKQVPNATYKEAYELLLKVYKDLISENKKIVIVGDSAGGGLALGFVEYLKEEKVSLPNKQVLISPWVDITLSNPDLAKFAGREVYESLYGFKEAGKKWADDLNLKNYKVSPVFGDLKGLPETLLFAGTEDFLYPDTTLLYKKLIGRNVKTTIVYGDGLFHVYPMFPIPEAEESRKIIVDFIKGTLNK